MDNRKFGYSILYKNLWPFCWYIDLGNDKFNRRMGSWSFWYLRVNTTNTKNFIEINIELCISFIGCTKCNIFSVYYSDTSSTSFFVHSHGLERPSKDTELSRGEICVANFIPPCEWCESGYLFSQKYLLG